MLNLHDIAGDSSVPQLGSEPGNVEEFPPNSPTFVPIPLKLGLARRQVRWTQRLAADQLNTVVIDYRNPPNIFIKF